MLSAPTLYFGGVLTMPKGKPRTIPKGTAWVEQAFNKPILLEPDGIVFRKATSVERNASEGLLITLAKTKGFHVTRIASHYIIHKKPFKPTYLTNS